MISTYCAHRHFVQLGFGHGSPQPLPQPCLQVLKNLVQGLLKTESVLFKSKAMMCSQ